MERPRHDLRNSTSVVDLGHPLGQITEHGPVIYFLERLSFTHASLDLTDEEDHRGRILASDVNARRGVGRSRATGDKADARLSGEFAVGFCHHGRATLLTANCHLDGRFMKGVERRQVTLSRNAERVGSAMDDQLIDEDTAAISLRNLLHPEPVYSPICPVGIAVRPTKIERNQIPMTANWTIGYSSSPLAKNARCATFCTLPNPRKPDASTPASVAQCARRFRSYRSSWQRRASFRRVEPLTECG